MTLKELFDKVEFKNLAPQLVKFDPKSEECLWMFKQAFDRMCLLPVGEDDGIVINVRGWSVWSGLQREWSDELARQIKYAKSSPLNKVAAAILWELTYYGFDLDDNPEWAAKDFQSRFEYDREYDESELDENPYRREWTELWQEAHDLSCRYPEDVGTKFFTANSVDELLAPLPHEKEEQLKVVDAKKEKVERKMRRYDLSTTLMAEHKSGIKDPEAFRQFIMDAPPFDVDLIKAVCPLEESADYLSDTIRDWFPAQEGSSSLVLIQIPEGIDSNDIADTVWAAFDSFMKLPKPKYILSTSAAAKEVKLTILTFMAE